MTGSAKFLHSRPGDIPGQVCHQPPLIASQPHMIGEERRSFPKLIGALPSRSIRGANSHGQGIVPRVAATAGSDGSIGMRARSDPAVRPSFGNFSQKFKESRARRPQKTGISWHDRDPLESSLIIREEVCDFMLDRTDLTSQTMLL